MQAKDILTATHKLEESDMSRSQSEAIANTIIAAVAPLATKADLKSMKEQMATKTDIENINTKFENINTKFESVNTKFESVNTRIESVKVWLLITLLGLTGSLLAVAASIALN